MKRRAQYFSTDGLLSTMEDTNAFEVSFPGILDVMKKLYPDDVVSFICFSVEVNGEWREVTTLLLG